MVSRIFTHSIGKTPSSRLSLAGVVTLTISLLLLTACGNDSDSAASTAASTTNAAVATTANPTTQAPASTGATTSLTTTAIPAPAVTTAPPATTVAPASVATTARPATTVAPIVTTVKPATTAATAATTAGNGVAKPIGNSYPAGVAPTPAAPAGGLVDVTLQVPDQFKKGVFSQPRTLKLPAGFQIAVYAQAQDAVRQGAFSPDNRLFLTERSGGRVIWLKANGEAGERVVFAQGLAGPHGIAFHNLNGKTYLYIAENNKVSRYLYENGQEKAGQKEVIVPNLPDPTGHNTRSIAFGKDGKMYIAVGSSCNVCEESDQRRAAVTRYNADGTGEKVFALGLRNEVGILFHPETGELWGVENSRDNLGAGVSENNNIPPEEINIIAEGNHYGWPYCYSNQVYDTNFGRKNTDFCKTTTNPALPMQAHSAPLGLDFYFPQNQQFPAQYRGDAFVAFHGSWNRSPATGYKLVRVRVQDGRPVSYEDFAVGWLTGDTANWGRPVAPMVSPDGSIYLTDDVTNAVYKISYKG